MNCILDNIIFSLQHSGGASVVWMEHIKRLLKEKAIDISFIEYRGAENNIFRKRLEISPKLIEKYSADFMVIKRYFNVNTQLKKKHIFHSSHYRIDRNKSAINITTVHDFTYALFRRGLVRSVHCRQMYDAIRQSDAIICISESTKKDLLYFLPDVKEDIIHVVYNGVNDCFHPLRENSDYILSIPFEDDGFALYVGGRTAYKNFPYALKFCKSLDLPLVIVGGGKLSKGEKDLIESYISYNSYVQYLGIDSEMLNELYNRACCLVYPSLYEGFGIPVVEAQKAGCPVIALNNSSIPEVMGYNTPLLLSESDFLDFSIIKNVVFDERKREGIINDGIEYSKRFSWNNTYKDTLDIYINSFENC